MVEKGRRDKAFSLNHEGEGESIDGRALGGAWCKLVLFIIVRSSPMTAFHSGLIWV